MAEQRGFINWSEVLGPLGLEAPGYQETCQKMRELKEHRAKIEAEEGFSKKKKRGRKR